VIAYVLGMGIFGVPEIIIAVALAAVAYVVWRFGRAIKEGMEQK
jgi:predicted PurR-regulated permease PerM